MSVTTGSTATAQTGPTGPTNQSFVESKFERVAMLWLAVQTFLSADQSLEDAHHMAQMGAKRIGSLAIGIGVVGIVLNEMVDLDIVANSSGVINVTSIFSTAGAGLNLLVVGVIIAAAAVLLSLWSGF